MVTVKSGLWAAALVSFSTGCGPTLSSPLQQTDASTSTTNAPLSTGGSATTAGDSSSTTGAGLADGATETGSESTAGEACDPDALIFECDPWTQDCPPCQKCTWFANDGSPPWNATRCMALPEEPKALGAPCWHDSIQAGGNDCGHGLICWDIGPEFDEGICVPLCSGSEDAPLCPNSDWQCTTEHGSFAHVCLPRCDPLAPVCPLETRCLFDARVEDSFVCRRVGWQSGRTQAECNFEGYRCDSTQSVCMAAELLPECQGDAGCCTLYCDLTLDPVAQCTAYPGTTCSPWPHWTDGSPVAPYEAVGVCLAP